MPNNWKTYKLSQVIKIIGGGTPRTSLPEYWNGDIPWLSVKDFQGEKKFVSETEKTITELGLSKSSTKLLPKGAMIISARGTVGELAVLEKEMTFNQSCYGLLPNEKTDGNFLYYLVKQKIKELQGLSYGSVFDTITTKTFDSLDVQVPSLKEQKAIANILSAIDDKIENNLAINKTLEDMAMALYKHWFVDFGPFQDGEFINSELGLIPKGWEVKRLSDLIEVVNGFAFKSKWFEEKGEKVLKIKNISNNVVSIENCSFISKDNAKSVNLKFKVNTGNFLIAMTGAEVGKVGIVPDYKQNLWLNQRVGKLKDKAFKNSSVFVGKILQSKEYYEIIQGLAYGSAQPNISATGLENIEIALPNNLGILDELIESYVNSHNEIIYGLTENQTLTKLRDTLLPKLISGEVRLKEFKEEVAEKI